MLYDGVWLVIVQHEKSKPTSRPSTQVKDYLQAGLLTCCFFLREKILMAEAVVGIMT